MPIDTYAVMGNPIAHSQSPFIHSEFAIQTHQAIQYKKIEVPLDKFEQSVRTFQQENGKGLNITVPFKLQAFNLVDFCSDRARIAKAVNTIVCLENDKLFGDNTDGVGFIRDITLHHQFSLKGQSILILGAGGAVRGILYPLIQEQPNVIVIANRTLATAEALVKEFNGHTKIDLNACSLEAIPGTYDLIVNGTSLNLQEEAIDLDSSFITADSFCYDLMYGKTLTPFLQWCLARGARRVTDGIGMLVEQAAESFFLWRNIRPNTLPVIEQLKKL